MKERTKKMDIKIGMIGGSGLYEIPGFKFIEEYEIDTPFGKPSDTFTIMEYDSKRIAFLPRHAKGHRYNPTNVNSRANIYALKKLGVQWIITISS